MRVRRIQLHRHQLIAIVVVPALLLDLCPAAKAEEAPAAEEADVALAERRGAEAFEAYHKKEYATAVALYLEAYKAAPSGSILYNIAHIYDTKLGDRSLAIVFYRRYLADPGASTERVEVVNERLRALRGAQLMASRLAKRSPGPGPATEPGESVSLPGQPSRDSSQGPGERPVNRTTTLRSTGLALGAAGLVGLGVGAGFGLAARSEARTASEFCNGNACTSPRGVDAAHTGRRDATISNIGFGAGGALLLTGAALFFFGADRAPERISRADRPHRASLASFADLAELRLEPQTTATELSLRVSGRW